jgi:hypothetical protein
MKGFTMPRIALQLSSDFVTAIAEMTGAETTDVFGDSTYAVVELIDPREVNIKLLTDDEIFEAAKNDSDLQIVTL